MLNSMTESLFFGLLRRRYLDQSWRILTQPIALVLYGFNASFSREPKREGSTMMIDNKEPFTFRIHQINPNSHDFALLQQKPHKEIFVHLLDWRVYQQVLFDMLFIIGELAMFIDVGSKILFAVFLYPGIIDLLLSKQATIKDTDPLKGIEVKAHTSLNKKYLVWF